MASVYTPTGILTDPERAELRNPTLCTVVSATQYLYSALKQEVLHLDLFDENGGKFQIAYVLAGREVIKSFLTEGNVTSSLGLVGKMLLLYQQDVPATAGKRETISFQNVVGHPPP